MPAPPLTAAELALHQRASIALDELERRWNDLGMPPDGKAGLLLAQFFRVCLVERGMSLSEALDDIIDCVKAKLESDEREQGSN